MVVTIPHFSTTGIRTAHIPNACRRVILIPIRSFVPDSEQQGSIYWSTGKHSSNTGTDIK
jgi:hypothetical protein